MDSPVRFTGPLLAFAIGVPLAWAVLLWFHQNVDPNHVYLLVGDMPGRAAQITGSRSVHSCCCMAPTRR